MIKTTKNTTTSNKVNLIVSVIVLLFMALSCNSSDDEGGYIALEIETNPDAVSLFQNSEIIISIFDNDNNIPNEGSLTISNVVNGTININTNGTLLDPSDDVVTYTPSTNFVGTDMFEYTICDANSVDNCKTEIVSITINSASSVNYNLGEMPYATLSEYNFFEGTLKDLEPGFGVIPYNLNASLFSDYAKKKRFIWMPSNSNASYIADGLPLNFPVGSILIKNFYYENVLPNNETKLLETRLMIKKSEGWIFANYIWNEEQTEAVFNLDGSFVDLQWQGEEDVNTVQYRIPSGAECHTCHKVMEISRPIGPKPRNLNKTFNYTDGIYNQLDKLVSIGYLDNSLPGQVSKLPDYDDESESLELRARAYLDINCAHCHSEETHCAYRPMRFDFSDTSDFTNIGVCVDPDTDLDVEDLSHIVEPGDARNSVLHYRLSSEAVSVRMPLLGRTVNHIEGIDLIELWIDSLTTTCD